MWLNGCRQTEPKQAASRSRVFQLTTTTERSVAAASVADDDVGPAELIGETDATHFDSGPKIDVRWLGRKELNAAANGHFFAGLELPAVVLEEAPAGGVLATGAGPIHTDTPDAGFVDVRRLGVARPVETGIGVASIALEDCAGRRALCPDGNVANVLDRYLNLDRAAYADGRRQETGRHDLHLRRAAVPDRDLAGPFGDVARAVLGLDVQCVGAIFQSNAVGALALPGGALEPGLGFRIGGYRRLVAILIDDP